MYMQIPADGVVLAHNIHQSWEKMNTKNGIGQKYSPKPN